MYISRNTRDRRIIRSQPQRTHARSPVTGRRLRDGVDHLRTVPYLEAHITACPVRAVEQLVWATCPARAVGQRTHTRWIGQEQTWYVFVLPTVRRPTREAGDWPVQGSQPSSETNAANTKMSNLEGRRAHSSLYALLPARRWGFTGVTRRSRRRPLLPERFWANPRTVSTYLRLREVVCPGRDGDVRIQGISEIQNRELNETPLHESSRFRAAFVNNSRLEQELKGQNCIVVR